MKRLVRKAKNAVSSSIASATGMDRNNNNNAHKEAHSTSPFPTTIDQERTSFRRQILCHKPETYREQMDADSQCRQRQPPRGHHQQQQQVAFLDTESSSNSSSSSLQKRNNELSQVQQASKSADAAPTPRRNLLIFAATRNSNSASVTASVVPGAYYVCSSLSLRLPPAVPRLRPALCCASSSSVVTDGTAPLWSVDWMRRLRGGRTVFCVRTRSYLVRHYIGGAGG